MDDLKTLSDAIRYFADEQACIDTIAAMRWPGGKAICPRCNSGRHYWLAKQRRWKCAGCKKQFTVKLGTIFEDSPIKLDKWLTAIWLIANSRNGVSSYEIGRSVGVTQKSAWFMMHRIRLALANDSWEKLGSDGSPVEADEAYIGGKPKNMHASRRLKLKIGMNGYAEKATVFGMLDRGTREVRAKVVPNAKRETLQKEILAQVGFGSTIYTDAATAYDHLKQKFVHDTVTHINEYVNGQVHTQGIENFWSLLKRGLNGTYVAVEPFHLSRSVDEQVFRFNNRIGVTDRMRFERVLQKIAGKRLTYAELTGKVGETPCGAPAGC